MDDTVTIGNMRVTFDPALPAAKRAKLIAEIEKAGGVRDRRPAMPRLTRIKVPTKDMLEAAGRGEVVLPDEALRAGLIKQAERELKLWQKHDPHGYARYMANDVTKVPTDQIERVLESILRPGGRVSGKFAASVVLGVAELERRRQEVAA